MKFLKSFLITITMGLIAFLLINYIVDPLQIIRRGNRFLLDSRSQVAGFIQTFDFDTVVLGTSKSQNFSKKSIDSKFKVHSLNFSMDGSEVLLSSFVLQKAIANKCPIKNVIWCLERSYLKYEDFPETFPKYLYDNKIGYCLNIKTLIATCKNVFFKNFKDEMQNFNKNIYTWNQWHKPRDPRLFEIIPPPSRPSPTPPDFRITKRIEIENFEKDVLDIIQKNPQISFYIFFPAHSIICLRNLKDDDMALRNYIMERLTAYPNVQFFDFETADWVTDLQNYVDPSYYDRHINEAMLNCFLSGQYLVTKDTLKSYQERFLKLWSTDVEIQK